MPEPVHIEPEIKGVGAAIHNLCDHAANCADIARIADPTKLPVSGDYAAALADLNHAVETGIIHEIYDATERFSNAFDLTAGMKPFLDSGATENELALAGAVLLLRGALKTRDDALEQLQARFPTREDGEK